MNDVKTRKLILIATAVVGLAVGAMVVQRKVVEHKEALAVSKQI